MGVIFLNTPKCHTHTTHIVQGYDHCTKLFLEVVFSSLVYAFITLTLISNANNHFAFKIGTSHRIRFSFLRSTRVPNPILRHINSCAWAIS